MTPNGEDHVAVLRSKREEAAKYARLACNRTERADFEREVAALDYAIKAVRPWQDAMEPPLEPGFYEVVATCDDGPEVLILQLNAEGDWIYEGEPTYCHSFYIEVTHWRERAAPPQDAAMAGKADGGQS